MEPNFSFDNLEVKNILVVEDEPIIALNIKREIEQLGFVVKEITATGEKAIKIVEENGIDLIIMDIRLKGELNGIETAKKINQIREIPIIFITAFSDDAFVEEAKQLLPVAYLQKPFQKSDLKIALNMGIFKYRTTKKLKLDEEKYRTLNYELEELISKRTHELQRSNYELKDSKSKLEDFISFLYHDVQEPVRRVNTYFELITTPNSKLDEEDINKYEVLCRQSIEDINRIMKKLKLYAGIIRRDITTSKFDFALLFKKMLDTQTNLGDRINFELNELYLNGDLELITMFLEMIIEEVNEFFDINSPSKLEVKNPINSHRDLIEITISFPVTTNLRDHSESKIESRIYNQIINLHNGSVQITNHPETKLYSMVINFPIVLESFK